MIPRTATSLCAACWPFAGDLPFICAAAPAPAAVQRAPRHGAMAQQSYSARSRKSRTTSATQETNGPRRGVSAVAILSQQQSELENFRRKPRRRACAKEVRRELRADSEPSVWTSFNALCPVFAIAGYAPRSCAAADARSVTRGISSSGRRGWRSGRGGAAVSVGRSAGRARIRAPWRKAVPAALGEIADIATGSVGRAAPRSRQTAGSGGARRLWADPLASPRFGKLRNEDGRASPCPSPRFESSSAETRPRARGRRSSLRTPRRLARAAILGRDHEEPAVLVPPRGRRRQGPLPRCRVYSGTLSLRVAADDVHPRPINCSSRFLLRSRREIDSSSMTEMPLERDAPTVVRRLEFAGRRRTDCRRRRPSSSLVWVNLVDVVTDSKADTALSATS